MVVHLLFFFFFFFNDTATTEIYTLSLHDALPISSEPTAASSTWRASGCRGRERRSRHPAAVPTRSEEHTSELQSPCNLVCRLLLEKKKKTPTKETIWTSNVTAPLRSERTDCIPVP